MYVKMTHRLQGLLERRGLVGQLQLVLFHPLAVHSAYADDGLPDAADYTIRSPLPTFHFLREVGCCQSDALCSSRATTLLPAVS